MAEKVRASHVVSADDTIMPMLNTGQTASARMWVYVGDHDHPSNVFDFTLNRGRDGPKYFLQDYDQVLLADQSQRAMIALRTARLALLTSLMESVSKGTTT
jgi:transposase